MEQQESAERLQTFRKIMITFMNEECDSPKCLSPILSLCEQERWGTTSINMLKM
jgi:hypothetical protein